MDVHKQKYERCKERAAKGDIEQLYNLGNMLLKGKGCEIDKEQAFEAFKKCAEKNNHNAQFMLGNLLRSGEGCTMNKQKAKEMYEKSAARGNANAQFNLATMYHHGKGCEVDHTTSMRFFQEAAFQGHAGALFSLGELLREGKVCIKDEATALEMLQKSASMGMRNAQCSLGYMYEKGIGCTRDEFKAFDLYLQAATQGNTLAQFRIGICYKNGVGCSISKSMYVAWFRKATSDRQKVAQILVGEEQQNIVQELEEFDKCQENPEGEVQEKDGAEITSASTQTTNNGGNENTINNTDSLTQVNHNSSEIDKKKQIALCIQSLDTEQERTLDLLSALAKLVSARGKKFEIMGKNQLAQEYELASRLCSPTELSNPNDSQISAPQKPGKNFEDPKYQALSASLKILREKTQAFQNEVERREREVKEREKSVREWFSRQEEQRKKWTESCPATVELVSAVHSL
eukprot:Phypoly_transcript_08091.p1 GENE.Phypoly_transcript_08091~~Phypoly_transcript_08091.p1  ORF type:complete len:460 (+),score=84.04 Phypoly_transcript_08091:133-1512(+)